MTAVVANPFGFRRLTAIWLAAVSLMVAILVLFQWYLEREQLFAIMSSQASAISANAGAALVFNDKPAAEEMLAVLGNQEAILEAALYRKDGSRLAGFQGRLPGLKADLGERAPPLGEKFSWRELDLARPIVLDGRRVGSIALRVSVDGVYAEIMRFASGLAIIATFATAFAFLATNRLRHRIAEKEVARRHAEIELAHSRDLLRQMMSHREHLLEEEHKRIAIEIHDQLGQLLTAAMLNLRSLERSLGERGKEVAGQLDEIQAQLNESYYGMKNIATLLHPAVLKFGFLPAIEWLAGRLLKIAGIHWRIETKGPAPVLDQDQSIGLFRIVQEALVNVVRHAKAGNVAIAIEVEEHVIVLEVRDDGQGFNPDSIGREVKFGLMGIRERAETLGGHATIASRPGQGTRVQVVLPLIAHETPTVGKK